MTGRHLGGLPTKERPGRRALRRPADAGTGGFVRVTRRGERAAMMSTIVDNMLAILYLAHVNNS